MKTIDPATLAPTDFYRLLNSAVAPRPIAFVSTISADGQVNLAPYSFFNVFGFNPPILVFSPSRNRLGEKKHSLLNVEEVPEVVVNVVNHRMVEQTSLASAEFDRHVSEFVKAGFTESPSTRVRPPRVAESPAAFECVVRQLVPVGHDPGHDRPENAGSGHDRLDHDRPGAGTLVICEVVMAHFHDDIFDPKGQIDPHRIDLVGRLGADWYTRASGDALFDVPRPRKGVGVDQLPRSVRDSKILTGNDLGRLGSLETRPSVEAVLTYRQSGHLNDLLDEARNGCAYLPDLLHQRAKMLLSEGKAHEAWLVLLQTSMV